MPATPRKSVLPPFLQGFMACCARHLLYFSALFLIGICMPLSDALFSPGTVMLLTGIGLWAPLQFLYLMPLAWRSGKRPLAYRWGMVLGVLPPLILSLAFMTPFGRF